jgi:tetratricopeptide (TPR) repeat protein
MQVRILKGGVLCMGAAVILLAAGTTRKHHADQPSDKPAEARRALSETTSSQDVPGASGHDLKVLEKALTKKPGHAPVLMNMAKIEEEKGRLDEAAKHLKEIVDQESGNLEARLELGRVLFQRGDVQGALDQTQAILKVQPGHPDALYNLGAIYGNLGNAARAREYWERLISLAPQSESGKRAQRMLPQLASLSR